MKNKYVGYLELKYGGQKPLREVVLPVADVVVASQQQLRSAAYPRIALDPERALCCKVPLEAVNSRKMPQSFGHLLFAATFSGHEA
jgi:hypothetical protein